MNTSNILPLSTRLHRLRVLWITIPTRLEQSQSTLFIQSVYALTSRLWPSSLILHMTCQTYTIGYSLNGHPSGPENWLFFQCSHMCTWQHRTSKCPVTHPVFSSVRNISRLFYFIFLLCTMNQNQFQPRHSRRKWRPLTGWTLGQWISQLIAGESILRSGVCFKTFLHLRVSSNLRQVRDENNEEKWQRRNDLHTPVPVSPLDLSGPHSGKHHGESFLCDYLNVWVLWLCAFIWSPAQWKSAWTDAGKLTEHFGTKYGWIEDMTVEKIAA